MLRYNYREILLKIAGLLVLIAFFSIFYPRGYITTAGGIAIVLGIVATGSLTQLHAYRHHWPMWFALLLAAMFYIGSLYSVLPLAEASQTADKYLWLVYTILLIPVWSVRFNKPAWQTYAYYAFLLGCVTVAVASTLRFYNLPNYSYLFVDEGFVRDESIMPFAAFLALQMVADSPRARCLPLIIFSFLSFEILYISHQRTSYIAYFLLLILFIIQRFNCINLKQWILTAGLMALGAIAVYHYSPTFNNGLQNLVSDAQQYNVGNYYTSSGDRAIMAKYSLKIWQQHPLFGAGTGSYGTAYNALQGPDVFECSGTGTCDMRGGVTHPHNEFAFIAAQLGSVGLILFVGLLLSLWAYSYRLPQLQRYLLQGLVLGFAFGCCTGDLLLNDKTRYWFVTFMGLLSFSQLKNTEKSV